MIDHAQAVIFLSKIEWPPGKRPLLGMAVNGERFVVRLYALKARVMVHAESSTQERALRAALVALVGEKTGMQFAPEFAAIVCDQARQLIN